LNSIRSFISLPLPADESDRLHERIRTWRKDPECQGLRWTPKTQLHLTLAFLGNVPIDSLETLTAHLQEIAASFPPLALRLNQLGSFPSSKDPRVVWVGLDGAIDDLHRLQAAIQQAAAKTGDHVEERPYHPHLTIARSAGRPTRQLRITEWLSRAILPVSQSWQAEHFHLMESRLSPQGAVHGIHSVFCLARKDLLT